MENTNLTTIDIVGSIRKLMMWVVTQLALLLGVILFGLSAPLLFTVGVEIIIWQNPADMSWAPIYFMLGPVACAIWMVFVCHWRSVRQWQREGRLDTWREDHGGIAHTAGKSTLFMIVGFFGSVLTEAIFLVVTWRLVGELAKEQVRESWMLYFAVAPFAVFAPVLIVLVWRWCQQSARCAGCFCTKCGVPMESHGAVCGPRIPFNDAAARLLEGLYKDDDEREKTDDGQFLNALGVAECEPAPKADARERSWGALSVALEKEGERYGAAARRLNLEKRVDEASSTWLAEARRAMERDPEAEFSALSCGGREALQNYLQLQSEFLAVLSPQDNTLKAAMLKVQRLAAVGTDDSFASAMALLRTANGV